ncbi:hypothetical protein [Rhodoferax koreensis]|uniref:hypothetical protein n=1 Tax=Rhodoferax koreensis TaxID=1842727 RepID=UPI0012FF7305|nr:hypothetical protein [Rhodoferax koreense]
MVSLPDWRGLCIGLQLHLLNKLPKGPEMQGIHWFAIATGVSVFVIAGLAVAWQAWHHRNVSPEEHRRQWEDLNDQQW